MTTPAVATAGVVLNTNDLQDLPGATRPVAPNQCGNGDSGGHDQTRLLTLISCVGPIRGPHGLAQQISWDEPEARWLWSQSPDPEEAPWRRRLFRWARLHAFDIEVGATVLIIGARAGFSPGEFLDFLLGWFGVDIAGDDHRLEPREKTGEGVDEE